MKGSEPRLAALCCFWRPEWASATTPAAVDSPRLPPMPLHLQKAAIAAFSLKSATISHESTRYLHLRRLAKD